MKKIKKTKILNTDATQIDIIVHVPLHSDTSTAFYVLKDADGGYLYDGIVKIPSEIHSVWGVDDSVIENFVLSELNLEIL